MVIVKLKRKTDDWRSATFFHSYTIEVKDGVEWFVSRTMCNRKGVLDHVSDIFSDDYTGPNPACWSRPISELEWVEITV